VENLWDVKSAQSFVSNGPDGVGTYLAGVAADVRRLEKISDLQPPISDLSLVTSAATRAPNAKAHLRIGGARTPKLKAAKPPLRYVDNHSASNDVFLHDN